MELNFSFVSDDNEEEHENLSTMDDLFGNKDKKTHVSDCEKRIASKQ